MNETMNAPIDVAKARDLADMDISKWSAKRRDFLRVIGLGAGGAAMGSLVGCDSNAATASEELRQQLAGDTAFWTSVQNKFILNPQRTFMNIGTAGSMPLSTLDLFDAENRAKAKESGSGYSNLLDQRTKVAAGFGTDASRGFGVDPDELAFSANTSSGMCHAILGLDWKAGDVVVTTNHEHGGGLTPLNIAKDRYGIEIDMIPMPVGNNQTAQTYVDLFENRIKALQAAGKRVRALMWSSPTYKTGTMLPVAELTNVAKKYSLISICDGAHLPGMMALNYAQLGMDFMSGAGHKWQCGPGSTGILIIRNKVRSGALPLPKWFPVHTSSYTAGQARTTNATATFDAAAEVTACGSLHTPMFNSLVKACEEWDMIGRKKIETYVLTMSKYLKEKIVERWGVDRLYAPKDDPKLLSALTSFNPFVNAGDITNGTKSTEFVNRMLSEHNFIIRNVNVAVIGAATDHWPLRISTHLWADADDIDRLVDRMWTLSRTMG